MYQLSSTGYAKLVTMINGKKFYLYNGYTYSFGFASRVGQRWRCSCGCKAFIVVSTDGNLIKASGTHNHRPNTYVQTADGRYCKTS